ncbi:MAG: DNA gyrase inhibitor YacG [Hellea sp.]|nr:DNA gyrase inhibitor YacG [Hellea sp.]
MSEKCKICNKAVSTANKPFCSKRCADVDLHRWLSGGYVVPGRDGEDMSDIVANGAANENEPET